MNRRNCKNCLYGDVCPSSSVCEHYAPIEDDGNLDAYIESERQKFYRDWLRYTSEDDD